MRIFKPVVTAAALMGVMMLSGCSGESISWHQKLTVEIETPQGLKTGFSIMAVTKKSSDGWWVPPEARGVHSKAKGEAVVVDLGNGRYLFALISGADLLAQKVFAPEIGLVGHALDRADWPDWANTITRLRGQRELSRQHYPMLVTFTDINDPKTVKRVNPNNLDASFGCENSVSRAIPAEPGILNNPPSGSSNPSPEPPSSSSPPSGPPSVAGQASSGSASPRTGGGADAPAKNQKCYKLKSITLEITNEPVTKGVVEGVLGWINDKTTLKLIWSNLSDEQHGLLSRGNWQRGS